MEFLSKCQKNVSLKPFSNYQIGGKASYLIEVDTIEGMEEILLELKERKMKWAIIGKGSNTLFDDEGFDGVVIINKIAFYKEEGDLFSVGAGYSFARLGQKTAKSGFSGLEFAVGVPGSVGGAVYMNAGANGQEIKDTLQEVIYLSEGGVKETRTGISFSYRSSPFQKEKGIILGASFKLTPSKDAKDLQERFLKKRLLSQPYNEKTIGCIFRNPEGAFAGELIEKCGLKGVKIGGAVVSKTHANFIVNEGEASSKDVKDLISLIQEKVKEKTGYFLQKEIKEI